jgi:hypothetical protein
MQDAHLSATDLTTERLEQFLAPRHVAKGRDPRRSDRATGGVSDHRGEDYPRLRLSGSFSGGARTMATPSIRCRRR